MIDTKKRIEEQYPCSGYTLGRSGYKSSKAPLYVVCPDHGEFETTWDNFIHNQGCTQCRGINSRAYPLKSQKSTRGNVVFIKAIDAEYFTVGEPTDVIADATIAVYFDNWRDAQKAIKVLNVLGSVPGIIHKSELDLAKRVMSALI